MFLQIWDACQSPFFTISSFKVWLKQLEMDQNICLFLSTAKHETWRGNFLMSIYIFEIK